MWKWITDNSTALMVVTTIVYVIATVCIFIANHRSVKAMHEQLEESKRQFYESQRLSIMPFLTASIGETVYPKGTKLPFPDMHLKLTNKERFQDDKLSWIEFGLTLQNIGAGMAYKIQAEWHIDNQSLPKDLKNTVIYCNHPLSINVSLLAEQEEKLYSKKGSLVIRFSDIAGNIYNQELIFNCSVRPFNQDVSIDTFQVMDPTLISQKEKN